MVAILDTALVKALLMIIRMRKDVARVSLKYHAISITTNNSVSLPTSNADVEASTEMRPCPTINEKTKNIV